MQSNLFVNHTDSAQFEDLALPGGWFRLYPAMLPPEEADSILERLIAVIPWRQDQIRIAGRRLPVPRLQCWMGGPESRYRYSGLSLTPVPWSGKVQALRTRVEGLARTSFNSVLLNYYRDGRDSVSWHADDEPELGPDPVIASLSLGAERPFELRRKNGGRLYRLVLPHGSLLLMGDAVQHHWQHRIPKVSGLQAPRVNLTFRFVRGTEH